jgi:hypothetical protein
MWEVHQGEWVVDGDRVVCRRDWRVGDDDPAWKEDAKVIAAAPEMLAMLRAIEDDEDMAASVGDCSPMGDAGRKRLAALLDRFR